MLIGLDLDLRLPSATSLGGEQEKGWSLDRGQLDRAWFRPGRESRRGAAHTHGCGSDQSVPLSRGVRLPLCDPYWVVVAIGQFGLSASVPPQVRAVCPYSADVLRAPAPCLDTMGCCRPLSP